MHINTQKHTMKKKTQLQRKTENLGKKLHKQNFVTIQDINPIIYLWTLVRGKSIKCCLILFTEHKNKIILILIF